MKICQASSKFDENQHFKSQKRKFENDIHRFVKLCHEHVINRQFVIHEVIFTYQNVVVCSSRSKFDSLWEFRIAYF